MPSRGSPSQSPANSSDPERLSEQIWRRADRPPVAAISKPGRLLRFGRLAKRSIGSGSLPQPAWRQPRWSQPHYRRPTNSRRFCTPPSSDWRTG